ncbi:hypothetical protein [Luteolibacter luteus]|uniref:Uncharacterized protein n=1 Tax=Luteolibacter luteus TaxID=2728835 RepID=A0A858RMG5_9BACT|nr:hypothetical protein [Luteolibacter luteus]QJE97648.1 hypothetical protein HHL09_18310 [Luteolibacter luteus]
MKTAPPPKKLRRGFISYVLVLTTGVILTILMMSAYRRAASAQVVQKESQIRVDYAEKEDAVLRAIINIAPNRAIRAMKSGSNANSSVRDPLRWQNIFSEALDQANARTSISTTLKTNMGAGEGITANVGDSTLTDINSIFDAIEPEPGYMSPGVNRSLGTGFPVPLQSNATIASNDAVYPIISTEKTYGTLAQGKVLLPTDDVRFQKVNKIPYPNIRFGYCAPGQPFVAKRNWWAFSMQIGENDALLKSFARNGGSEGERDFILSIYEIPSQLAISAEAFTSLGAHADGTAWQRATIEGAIYSTRADVVSGMKLDRLSSRRGMTLGSGVKVDGKEVGENPFKPGEREKFELANNGTFQPVTMASEAGRAAFIPINRGSEFFDRFTPNNRATESNTVSPTTWNTYSSGAMQCAMRLDINGVVSATNPQPTRMSFSYTNSTGTRVPIDWPLEFTGYSNLSGMKAGFAAMSTGTYTFNEPVDLIYGVGGKWAVKYGVTGTATLNEDYFGGDPNPQSTSANLLYYRPQSPWEVKMLHGTRYCVAVYPKRIKRMLAHLGGSTTTPENNPSLVVNVDYTQANLVAPSFPAKSTDYGVLLYECDDLTSFKNGFSLVTNMRLYIGDDFNQVSMAAPTGSNLPAPFFPPCSLFAPEKRYGTDQDPFEVKITGQLGHLGGDTGKGGAQVHLLDLKNGNEEETARDRINVNLKPITHPCELPPISMMNWLVVIEERRKEFYSSN